jgi:DnaJ-class molecular chaperone
MANLINAECPNCGAVLELPEDLDRAHCIHCGSAVIIGKDETHYHSYNQKTAIACPECHGKGYFICGLCRGMGSCTAHEKYYVNGVYHKDFCYYGWCPVCKGKGTNNALILKSTCTFCKGAKVCPYCKGTHKCNICRGSGKIICNACKGSGFKVYRGK